MNLQRSAEIQVVLEGIALPARRDDLIRYAAQYDEEAARELRQIPDREYRRIDDVGGELAATGVARGDDRKLPKPESGEPPGGDAYLEPFPEPGEVTSDAPRDNPPQKAIEEAQKTVERQAQ